MPESLEDLRYPLAASAACHSVPVFAQRIFKRCACCPSVCARRCRLNDAQLDTPYREGAGRCARWCITSPTATPMLHPLQLALTEDWPL